MAFDAFALVLAMLALGYLFQRLRVLPDSAAQTLNLVVLYVCLPAAVLRYALRLVFERWVAWPRGSSASHRCGRCCSASR